MGAVNAGLVGQLGTQQLSAVSLGTLAVSFVTFLYSFLLFLTVPEIAAAVVRKDDDEVGRSRLANTLPGSLISRASSRCRRRRSTPAALTDNDTAQ